MQKNNIQSFMRIPRRHVCMLGQTDLLIQHDIAHALAIALVCPTVCLKETAQAFPCAMHRAVRLTVKNLETVRALLTMVSVLAFRWISALAAESAPACGLKKAHQEPLNNCRKCRSGTVPGAMLVALCIWCCCCTAFRCIHFVV